MNAVVIGCGRTGSAVAKGLAADGWDVTVVDENEDEHPRPRRARDARARARGLLALQKEGLEIVEAQIESGSPAAGTRVAGLALPDGSRLVSVFRHGRTELVEPGTVIRPGDQVLAVVVDDSAAELRRVLLGAPK